MGGVVPAGAAARRARRRWRPANWRFRTKLLVVLLVPLLLVAVLGGLRVADTLDRAEALDRFGRHAELADRVATLVHQLQRERTLVVAAPGGGDAGVDGQILRVDAGLAALHARQPGDVLTPGAATAYRTARDVLAGLPAVRDEALSGTAPAEAVMISYDSHVAALRELQRAALAGAPPPLLASAERVRQLGSAAEQVARQRAVLLAALRAGALSASQQAALRAGQARFDAAVSTLRGAADAGQRAVAAAADDERARLVGLALQRSAAGQPLGIEPRAWDDAAAATGDVIRGAESALTGRLRADAAALGAQLRDAAIRDAVVLAVLSLLLAALLAIVVRSLLRPLQVLRTATFDVADRRLPEVFERVRAGHHPLPRLPVDPIPVHSREEIGHLARAVDAVHTEAVRLAAEHAAMRSNVTDVLMTLSRRSQRLVQQQLELIEGLQRGDPGPELLSHLYALDHLAVRMHRSSENLLILAGAEPPVRAGYPVGLLDVLRSAASEVADYQRIVVRRPPDLAIDGTVAHDLVHLIAELLDNATSFSEPDTEVVVSADRDEQGWLQVEIIDSGQGMTADRLREVNEKLAAPPVPDEVLGSRTGLFVVGRLAGRHGMAVRLRRRVPSRGLTAVVEIPAAHLPVGTAAPTWSAAAGRQRGPDLPVPVQVTVRDAADETTPAQRGTAAPADHEPTVEELWARLFGTPSDAGDDAGPEPVRRGGRGDEGWRAAATLRDPPAAGTTAAGLPRRAPRARLVPGSVPGTEGGTETPPRDADAVHDRLSRYQQGLRRGRHARHDSRDDEDEQ